MWRVSETLYGLLMNLNPKERGDRGVTGPNMGGGMGHAGVSQAQTWGGG